ncbi:MAG: ankyrin repeat domain-containing protein [Gemmatimonadetes bacterium]|nr:ankyrin repeat domain-containing protein [Gemmatimonadota bacterium]
MTEEFEKAVDAVISGDIGTLKSLLEREPDLIRMRSSRAHRAMLIHYVAANGVEDERQRTPVNAVDVANVLIDAGAEIDATFLDGGSGTTPLVSLVTSFHPHKAGVAAELVSVFVNASARVDGLKGDGEPLRLALSSEYPESVQALLKCGAKIMNVEVAAGLGEFELVEKFVDEGGVVRRELEEAFWSACKYGHTEVVECLLKRGVDIDAKGGANNTGLMLASQRGRRDTVEMLLECGASVELKNDYGGTALGSTMYFLANHTVPDADYAGVIELLLNAGSEFNFAGKTTGDDGVDDMLRRRGVILLTLPDP